MERKRARYCKPLMTAWVKSVVCEVPPKSGVRTCFRARHGSSVTARNAHEWSSHLALLENLVNRGRDRVRVRVQAQVSEQHGRTAVFFGLVRTVSVWRARI